MESTRTCSEPGCDRGVRTRGLCPTHYQALRRAAKDGTCEVGDCAEGNFTRGFCSKHYQRFLKYGSTELPTPTPRGACSVESCTKVATTRTGLCDAHYQRAQRYGDPEAGGARRKSSPRGASIDDRFWSKVDKSGSCWMWTGATTLHGYGNFFLSEGEWTAAHRYAFGEVPDGMELDHLCHTLDASCTRGRRCQHRRCVNPAHLEPVTTAENLRRARERSIK